MYSYVFVACFIVFLGLGMSFNLLYTTNYTFSAMYQHVHVFSNI